MATAAGYAADGTDAAAFSTTMTTVRLVAAWVASVSSDVLRLRRWSDVVAFSDSRPRRAASGAGNVVVVACRAQQPPPASQPLPA